MKNIIIIILAVFIVLLLILYFYSMRVSFPKKAEESCANRINNEVIPKLQEEARQQCIKQIGDIEQYQQMLGRAMQIPACASALNK